MVKNCQITEIGLWYECHDVCSLRVKLSCNCTFQIELSKLNKFINNFLQCFDEGPVGSYNPIYIETLKGKYLRAHFDDNESLIGLQHIIKDYGFDLDEFTL